MNVVIIEDELIAAQNIKDALKEYDATIQVLAVLRTVKKAIDWLSLHLAEVDVLLMDIKLTDGISFQIFDAITIQKPIIFTTAYDEYAIRAFKVNSIDYLLKPIAVEDLAVSFKKLNSLVSTNPAINYQLLAQQIQLQQPAYKNRFLVRQGTSLFAIPTSEIAYFIADGNLVLLRTTGNKSYPINYPLELLEDQLEPESFFRINRKMIVHIQAINKIMTYFKGRLKVAVHPPVKEDLIVSHKRASAFKQWLDR